MTDRRSVETGLVVRKTGCEEARPRAPAVATLVTEA